MMIKGRFFVLCSAFGVAMALFANPALSRERDVKVDNVVMTPEEEVCACVMCLIGEASEGTLIPECDVLTAAFYSIEVTVNLVFNPIKTLEARRDYLSLCPFVEKETIDEANNSARRSNVASGYYLVDGTPLTWEDLYKLQLEHGFDIIDALLKEATNKH